MKEIKKNNLQKLVRIIIKEALDALDEPSRGWIFEGLFHEHKDWMLYESENGVTAVFKDKSRLNFEVRYPGGVWGDDKQKWKHKAASKWKSIAREIYNSQGLSEGGNPIIKPWKICYQEALKDPRMKEFVRLPEQGTPVFDPVNFTSAI